MSCETLVLCTDLDRTLLPNGSALEPEGAQWAFKKLVARNELRLVYVSGRDQSLVQKAMVDYGLPQPDYAITDVGATIYRIDQGDWHLMDGWYDRIGLDWRGMSSWDLRKQLSQSLQLQLQPESKQGLYKLSYQLQPADQLNSAVDELLKQLTPLDIQYNCITSIDETSNMGLVDILPHSANKRLAIEFLMEYLDIPRDRLVFSGDSGNDLDVLLSPFKATLVGNATAEVKQLALQQIDDLRRQNHFYIAQGNYSAGILEGFFHYFPHVKKWIEMD